MKLECVVPVSFDVRLSKRRRKKKWKHIFPHFFSFLSFFAASPSERGANKSYFLLFLSRQLAMGSSNGGSDNDEAKVLPKLETEGEEKREVEGDTKGDDLGLVELKTDEPVIAPAVPAPPPPQPPQQPPAASYHTQPLAPLGNPKAKHCYDK